MSLPDPKIPWWRAPAGRQQFLAYYMCLRYHHEMPAAEALATARRNAEALGINGPGFMETLRRGINAARQS